MYKNFKLRWCYSIMKLNDFNSWFEDKKNLIGLWNVEPNKNILSQFTIGCYFDSIKNKYIVYKNGERNNHTIYLETEDEDEAYNKLQSMILFEKKNNEGYY